MVEAQEEARLPPEPLEPAVAALAVVALAAVAPVAPRPEASGGCSSRQRLGRLWVIEPTVPGDHHPRAGRCGGSAARLIDEPWRSAAQTRAIRPIPPRLDAPHHSVTCRPRPRQGRHQACLEGGLDLPACVAALDGSSRPQTGASGFLHQQGRTRSRVAGSLRGHQVAPWQTSLPAGAPQRRTRGNHAAACTDRPAAFAAHAGGQRLQSPRGSPPRISRTPSNRGGCWRC